MDLSTLAFISQSVCTCALNLIMFLFFRKMYGTKYTNVIIYIASFIVACVLMVAVNILNIPVLNILYGFISFNVICVLLFNTSLKQSILYNSILIFFLLFSDIITVFIWTVIQGEALQNVLNDSILMMISNALNILVMILVYKIFFVFVGKKELKSIQLQETIFLFFINLFEILIIYIFTQKANEANDGILIFAIIIGFVFLNIYATYIIDRVSAAYKLKYELSMMKRQSELQLANYTEMNKQYERSRKVIHDIKKHLNVLSELTHKDNQKTNTYSEMIEKEVDSLFSGFQCSNEILSIVFSQKISLAESLNINVETKVEDINFDFMSDLDITALFANIWDNAIEASKKAEEKHIAFEISKVNGFILITEKNSFNGKIKQSNGRILSSKKNHTGVGLSIIKSTVEKYKGLFTSNIENKTFCIEITIPIT